MLGREYNIGDKLRIRSWEDMEKEFGADYDGNIECLLTFCGTMKYMCGEPFTVCDRELVCGKDERYIYHSSERIEGCFSITSDMLEPIKPKPLKQATEKELMNLIFSQ